ncbi:MAG: hypothetical protein F4223_07655 [Rhodobacteraceae bacterium]|nr:hypothetical protein [Paracoccaceae bacterium]
MRSVPQKGTQGVAAGKRELQEHILQYSRFIKLLDKNNMGSAADRLRTSKWLSVKVFFEKVKSSWGR